jgi:hypothetical protein
MIFGIAINILMVFLSIAALICFGLNWWNIATAMVCSGCLGFCIALAMK